MSKNLNNDEMGRQKFDGTDATIRSLDASTIYYNGRPEGQIQEYLSMKEKYYNQKKLVQGLNESSDDREEQIKLLDSLEQEYKKYFDEVLSMIDSTNDFKLPKCSSKVKDGTSNMSPSLMRMELQRILMKK